MRGAQSWSTSGVAGVVYPARAKAVRRVLDGPAVPGVDAFLLESVVKVHAGALVHAARSLQTGDIVKI